MITDEQLAKLTGWLQEKDIPFQENVEIARLSQIKAGGVFLIMVKPSTEGHVKELMAELDVRALPYKIIGNLSNVLFRDGDIRTIAISMRGLRTLSFEDDGTVVVGAGVMLPTLATKLVQAGYQGFAGLIGVPARLGGAVYMNASCFGDATSDYLEEVRCVNPGGDIQAFKASELNFVWRHSAFHDRLAGCVIIAAKFRPVIGDKEVEAERERNIKLLRRTYQENVYPNLGSTYGTLNIYGDLARCFIGYRVVLILIKILTRITRTSLSDGHHRFAAYAVPLTKAYFHLKGSSEIDFSKSTFNCVVNRGGAKADDIIEFVLRTDRAINKCVPLEIELLKDIE
jgi:UDP-N-acetylmuramate dehydrogenase